MDERIRRECGEAVRGCAVRWLASTLRSRTEGANKGFSFHRWRSATVLQAESKALVNILIIVIIVLFLFSRDVADPFGVSRVSP